MLLIVILMLSLAVGGAIFAFSGGERVSTKRVTAIAKPEARVKAVDGGMKRKNVQSLLKEIESKQAEKVKEYFSFKVDGRPGGGVQVRQRHAGQSRAEAGGEAVGRAPAGAR